MAVTILWLNSWAVISISLSIVVLILIFVLLCVCWELEKDILDESDKTIIANLSDNSLNDLSSYRRFSSVSENEVYDIEPYPSDTMPILNNVISESDLHDSMEISNKFNKSILKLVDNKDEEMMVSCKSVESRSSFYSVNRGLGGTGSSSDTHYIHGGTSPRVNPYPQLFRAKRPAALVHPLASPRSDE